MLYYAPTRISENIHETPEGFLVCLGVPLTRTGALEYGAGETPLEGDADGNVTMWRTEEDVFDDATMASFEGKPVTIEHPEDFVGPDNWQDLAVGFVTNVRRGKGKDSDKLLGDLVITAASAIALVKSGLREVSCGYEAEYTQIDDGEGRQSGIIGNHVALVERGRAGPSCAIQDHEQGKSTMSKIKKLQQAISAAFADVLKDDTEEAKKVAKAKAVKDAAAAAVKKAKDAAAKAAAMADEDGENDGDKLDEIISLLKNMCEPAAEDEMDPDAEEAAEEEATDEGEESAEGETESTGMEAKLEQILDLLKKLAGKEAPAETSSEDSDPAPKVISGDTASRAEILVPGIRKKTKATGDALKAKALELFADTAAGTAVLTALNGGKTVDLSKSSTVKSLFVSASDVLKQTRAADMASTKSMDNFTSLHNGPMTPEKINAANEARYGKKQ